jgi:AraC-like DNA-binding protein
MEYILIIGTFEAFFLLLLLSGKKQKSKADYYLGIVFLLYGISIGLTYLEIFNRQNNFPFPFLINVSWLFLLLHGPALWIYIKALSVPRFKVHAIHAFHLIPFFIFVVAQYFLFINLPLSERIALAASDVFQETLLYKFSVIAIALSTISYNIWAIRLINLHQKRIKQTFSKLEGADLKWLKILTIAWLICYGINVALFNLDLLFNFASYETLTLFTYSIGSLYILVLGYFGMQQGKIFSSTPYAENYPVAQNTYFPQKKTGEEETAFIQTLKAFMEKDKPYLEPELTLSGLAQKLKIRPDDLSKKLNTNLNISFYDFVNRYRIEEFKIQAAADHLKQHSIMGLAYNSGFNSKAAFYRAFKKFEKTSPSYYLESVSKK